jgi:hypothetical protein
VTMAVRNCLVMISGWAHNWRILHMGSTTMARTSTDAILCCVTVLSHCEHANVFLFNFTHFPVLRLVGSCEQLLMQFKDGLPWNWKEILQVVCDE